VTIRPALSPRASGAGRSAIIRRLFGSIVGRVAHYCRSVTYVGAFPYFIIRQVPYPAADVSLTRAQRKTLARLEREWNTEPDP
jgi:hypothetical protein